MEISARRFRTYPARTSSTSPASIRTRGCGCCGRRSTRATPPKNRRRRTDRERDAARDGYLLRVNPAGEPDPIDAERLGDALCAGGHRPQLVAFQPAEFTRARIAHDGDRQGRARGDAPFRMSSTTDLVELFFGSFYRAWRKERLAPR